MRMFSASMRAGFLASLVLFMPAAAFAGSQTYSTPGTYTFTVPSYSSLTVDVKGAGGGGGYPALYWGYAHGYDGTYSQFGSATAVRGNGGGGWGNPYGWPPPAIPGTASGGDTNTTGGGSAAGYHTADACADSTYNNCRGGAGGRAVKTWSSGGSGAPAAGSSVTIVVGTLGAQYSGFGVIPGASSAVAAQNGSVTITWSEPTPPSCSVTLTPNPINQGSSSILSWSSTNATSVYITNVGYVSTSGSTSVAPSVTTSYSGSATGAGGSAACSGTQTLTVHPSCNFNGQTVTHGSGVTAYLASTVPYGSSCSSQTRTCSDGTLSGSYQYASCSVNSPASCTQDGATVAHGASRTFYSQTSASGGQVCSAYGQSRTCTNGTLSGSYPYASCSCTPAYTCSGNDIRYTDASCTTSTTATCAAPSFCSEGSSVCLNPNPSFNSSGSLTGHLQTRPSLIPLGLTAKIHWDVSNVQSCSVSGTNGDAWTGTSSGVSGKTSSAIVTQTTYTLSCIALSGATPASFSETAVVNVIPVFEEL